ncbi:MAG: S8 family peptidase [Lachnospiraceae bacterium]|nr:S8 family peptidase [Lachnospiraceae bacterium]
MPEENQCWEQIVSNDYRDEIAGYYGRESLLAGEDCYQIINEDFAVIHRPGNGELQQSTQELSNFIPYCYGLLQENLEITGVNRVRRIPGFDYRGSGILLGFVDTGIDYSHPVFVSANGVSRVVTIWDQNDQSGTPPEGFYYGTEFGTAEIAAGTAPKDENGHGTFLAGIAGGAEDREYGFTGVAPLAEIAMVKLKEAKPYLKEYYCMPEDTLAFSEADIMLGVRYLLEYAARKGRPLVLCLGIGCSLGSHRGTVPLSLYLNSLAYRTDVGIIVAAGNEGNARHHARLNLGNAQKEVEVYVGSRGSGFTMEVFAEAIAELNLRIVSPAGDDTPVVGSGFTGTEEFSFLFDRSVVFVERESLMRTGTLQRIRLRFQRPAPGIWRLQFGRSEMAAEVTLWLPMSGFIEGEVYFLESDPEVTLCEPGNAPLLLTVGGFSSENGSLAPFSGRGFTADGLKQPTLLAPAVNVTGPFAGGGYLERNGTSAGAAYTAGTVALFLEYIEEYRQSGASVPMDTVLLRNLFSLGASREQEVEYPSPTEGYGKLNLYGVFEFLRNL